jgi:DNA-binding GntR family transcriptional regulator
VASAMVDRKAEPAYIRIAGILRSDIAGGRFEPGQRLPSETQLMLRHAISRSVAKWAFALLKADGLVEGRQGAGMFVRATRRVPCHSTSLDNGRRVDLTEQVQAGQDIARRLALAPDDLVVHTRSRSFPNDGLPYIVETWRPVRHRSGLVANKTQERVTVRSASPKEIIDLALPSRGMVLVVARCRLANKIPIEASDMTMPSDRIELIYDLKEP